MPPVAVAALPQRPFSTSMLQPSVSTELGVFRESTPQSRLDLASLLLYLAVVQRCVVYIALEVASPSVPPIHASRETSQFHDVTTQLPGQDFMGTMLTRALCDKNPLYFPFRMVLIAAFCDMPRHHPFRRDMRYRANLPAVWDMARLDAMRPRPKAKRRTLTAPFLRACL